MSADPRTQPPRRPDNGVDQETGDPGRQPEHPGDPATDASVDPGTNRTHAQPDESADTRQPDGRKHAEKSPYTAGQQ
jgi:hypothetical protein